MGLLNCMLYSDDELYKLCTIAKKRTPDRGCLRQTQNIYHTEHLTNHATRKVSVCT